MKRFAVALVAAFACLTLSTSDLAAQSRFGVIGGFTFSKLDNHNLNLSTMTQYHAGLTYQLKLPLGFSIQPSLLYQVKGAKVSPKEGSEFAGNQMDLNMGFLELPVSVQWGPDLLLFRPFLEITPFVGYGLNNKLQVSGSLQDAFPVQKNTWDAFDLRRFEYGLGLGVGLEIWKFQLIGRYNWNFGSLADFKKPSRENTLKTVKNAFSKTNFGGFTLSAAFLF